MIRIQHEFINIHRLAKCIGLKGNNLHHKLRCKTVPEDIKEKIKDAYIEMFSWIFKVDNATDVERFLTKGVSGRILLMEDECAPDAYVYFCKEFQDITGFTVQEFESRAKKTEHGFILGVYQLEYYADAPYWHLIVSTF